MQKCYRKVQIYSVAGGDPFEITGPAGNGVWEGLKGRHDVTFSITQEVDDAEQEYEVFVPFHAVGAAFSQMECETVDAPVDSLCVAEEDGGDENPASI